MRMCCSIWSCLSILATQEVVEVVNALLGFRHFNCIVFTQHKHNARRMLSYTHVYGGLRTPHKRLYRQRQLSVFVNVSGVPTKCVVFRKLEMGKGFSAFVAVSDHPRWTPSTWMYVYTGLVAHFIHKHTQIPTLDTWNAIDSLRFEKNITQPKETHTNTISKRACGYSDDLCRLVWCFICCLHLYICFLVFVAAQLK